MPPPQASAIPNTLGDVWQRVRSLLSGSSSNFGLYQRPYLLPFINQAYEEMTLMIKNASGKNLEACLEVLNIPAGQSDLSMWEGYAFVQPGVNPPPAPGRGPLAGLYDPLRIWAKAAGALPQYYQLARGPKDYLPNINPPGIPIGTYAVVIEWTWLGNNLCITPIAGPIDIKVYGRFNPPRLQDDNDRLVLYKDMTSTLVAATCAWTGIERSNTTILQGCQEQAQRGVDNIVADLIRQTQGNQRRPGRMGRGGFGGCGWGWSGSW
jgi:hypothetical protein